MWQVVIQGCAQLYGTSIICEEKNKFIFENNYLKTNFFNVVKVFPKTFIFFEAFEKKKHTFLCMKTFFENNLFFENLWKHLFFPLFFFKKKEKSIKKISLKTLLKKGFFSFWKLLRRKRKNNFIFFLEKGFKKAFS